MVDLPTPMQRRATVQLSELAYEPTAVRTDARTKAGNATAPTLPSRSSIRPALQADPTTQLDPSGT